MGEKCVMIRIDELVGIVVAALLLLIGPTRRSTAVAGEAIPMNEINKDFGKLNPNAPSVLSRFAFLIGRWRCWPMGYRRRSQQPGLVVVFSTAMESRTDTG